MSGPVPESSTSGGRGPRVSIVNYTLSMMRGGGETRDLAFATHLRDLGCDVTLVSVDPLLGKVRHPITGVPSRLLRAPYFRDLVYRLMVLPKTGRLATFLLNQDFKRFSKAVIDLVADVWEQAALRASVHSSGR